MRKFIVFLVLTVSGFFIGANSSEFTTLSQSCTITVRSGNPADLQKALDEAKNNLRDDVICVEGHYRISNPLSYYLPEVEQLPPPAPPRFFPECGKKLLIKSIGKGTIFDGGGVSKILSIDTFNCGSEAPAGEIVIEGIEFRGGSDDGLFVNVYKDDVVIRGNSFISNQVWAEGSPVNISTFYGTVRFIKNRVARNLGVKSSGIFINSENGLVLIADNLFEENYGENSGAVSVNAEAGSIRVTGNTFLLNGANKFGGGAYLFMKNGSVVLTNNVFANNLAEKVGGGAVISVDNGSVFLINNTVIMNAAEGGGAGGVYVFLRNDNANAHLYNNIIWGNVGISGWIEMASDLFINNDGNNNGRASLVNMAHNLFSLSNKSIDFSSAPQTEKVYVVRVENYNRSIANGCVNFGNYGNMQNDPRFVGIGNLRLRSGSPAIDKGCNSAPEIPNVDKDGNARIVGSAVDMGAYEYSGKDDKKGGGCSMSVSANPVNALFWFLPMFVMILRRWK